ncbi:SRPBCC family protein [Asanoa siamensis]|uniref:SRPBCC family protein n=1 Tax=Asanoa siamensis TaxID=926357 RepID=UPI001940906F|nr:SRPBCC family protein [Asanoa siamensis]
MTTRTIQVRERASVDLPRSAEATFDFLWDPVSSFTISDSVDVAAALPGRRGLGEIQAVVERTPAGRVGVLHEVIEHEPGRRAVTRGLVGVCPTWSALSLEPLGPGSCRLTQEFWADLPAGVQAGMDRQLSAEYRRRLDLMMRRLGEWAGRQAPV